MTKAPTQPRVLLRLGQSSGQNARPSHSVAERDLVSLGEQPDVCKRNVFLTKCLRELDYKAVGLLDAFAAVDIDPKLA